MADGAAAVPMDYSAPEPQPMTADKLEEKAKKWCGNGARTLCSTVGASVRVLTFVRKGVAGVRRRPRFQEPAQRQALQR